MIISGYIFNDITEDHAGVADHISSAVADYDVKYIADHLSVQITARGSH